MTTARFSRRQVLSGALASSVVASMPIKHAFAQIDDQPFFFLSNNEARYLASLCDTLIPRDDYPSASEAGVVDFIDLQMSSGYGKGEGLFLEGPFDEGTPEQGYQLPLTPAEFLRQGLEQAMQGAPADAEGFEAHATALSKDEVPFGDLSSKQFFDEVWKLTNQGYFADPIYGGNTDYAGWKMVGFPGAHAYYLSFVDKHNRPYRQPPMGVNHQPGGNGAMPRPHPANTGGTDDR
ncbi:gluconate 2-dehydrogenase subunit 3 family protein [Pseudaestuariivita sp.]|uniref:gluconate 2-dehydrogenase subunit 3 family protein n=1 Tax=Pseudaestuariivita sp. TaxID=2211669 RepID=UPI00405A116E